MRCPRTTALTAARPGRIIGYTPGARPDGPQHSGEQIHAAAGVDGERRRQAAERFGGAEGQGCVSRRARGCRNRSRRPGGGDNLGGALGTAFGRVDRRRATGTGRSTALRQQFRPRPDKLLGRLGGNRPVLCRWVGRRERSGANGFHLVDSCLGVAGNGRGVDLYLATDRVPLTIGSALKLILHRPGKTSGGRLMRRFVGADLAIARTQLGQLPALRQGEVSKLPWRRPGPRTF